MRRCDTQREENAIGKVQLRVTGPTLRTRLEPTYQVEAGTIEPQPPLTPAHEA